MPNTEVPKFSKLTFVPLYTEMVFGMLNLREITYQAK